MCSLPFHPLCGFSALIGKETLHHSAVQPGKKKKKGSVHFNDYKQRREMPWFHTKSKPTVLKVTFEEFCKWEFPIFTSCFERRCSIYIIVIVHILLL